jgi:hypothetical protein
LYEQGDELSAEALVLSQTEAVRLTISGVRIAGLAFGAVDRIRDATEPVDAALCGA